MRVHELIEFLRTQPQDAHVVYQAYSDYWNLEDDDMSLVTAEMSREKVEADAAKRASGESSAYAKVCDAYMIRGGKVVNAYPLHLFPEGETPAYEDVLVLPGN